MNITRIEKIYVKLRHGLGIEQYGVIDNEKYKDFVLYSSHYRDLSEKDLNKYIDPRECPFNNQVVTSISEEEYMLLAEEEITKLREIEDKKDKQFKEKQITNN